MRNPQPDERALDLRARKVIPIGLGCLAAAAFFAYSGVTALGENTRGWLLGLILIACSVPTLVTGIVILGGWTYDAIKGDSQGL